MKNTFLFLFSFCTILSYANQPFWGKTGHRATAEIASTYLTKKATKGVHDLLDGEGMALVSTFGDDIKSDHKYDKYRIWHYTDIPDGKTYDDIKGKAGEDIFYAINKCIAGLKDNSTPRDKKQFYLKMLIHLIGDLHQPMHVGKSSDKGGNDIKVTWFGQKSNLHRVWDENLLDSYLMSYTELADNQAELTDSQVKQIQKGSILDWLKDTHKVTEKIYTEAGSWEHLGYNYMYDWMPTVREQLQKGGIRLAKVLNDIFG